MIQHVNAKLRQLDIRDVIHVNNELQIAPQDFWQISTSLTDSQRLIHFTSDRSIESIDR
jgi:hypothetical protein